MYQACQHDDSLDPDETPCGGDDRVRDHYEDPHNQVRLSGATHSAEVASPVCDDRVRVAVRVSDEVIEEAGFEGDGCVISQAAASMLCEAMEGKTVDQARAFSAGDMIELFGHSVTPDRQKCCLLPWRCLQAALEQPLHGEDDLDYDGIDFGGPSLSEES